MRKIYQHRRKRLSASLFGCLNRNIKINILVIVLDRAKGKSKERPRVPLFPTVVANLDEIPL